MNLHKLLIILLCGLFLFVAYSKMELKMDLSTHYLNDNEEKLLINYSRELLEIDFWIARIDDGKISFSKRDDVYGISFYLTQELPDYLISNRHFKKFRRIEKYDYGEGVKLYFVDNAFLVDEDAGYVYFSSDIITHDGSKVLEKVGKKIYYSRTF